MSDTGTAQIARDEDVHMTNQVAPRDEMLLEALFGTTVPTIIAEKCGEGDRIIFYNPAATAIIGIPAEYALGVPEEFDGSHVTDSVELLKSVMEEHEWEEFLARLANGGVIQNFSCTFTNLVTGVSVPVLLTVDILTTGNTRRGSVITFVDASEIVKKAMTDELTSLPNRRAFNAAIRRETTAVDRGDSCCGFLFLDIDLFKGFNDRYGHQVGDDVLREVAAAIARSVPRTSDLAARYGGEEFVVVLPNTTIEAAQLVAERIRAAVEDTKVNTKHHGEQSVTVSIGVANTDQVTWPANASNAVPAAEEELIRLANNAMKAAKDAGRNRVHLAG